MKSNKGFFSNIKSDLPASIVVFLVAMPLCLGIALASGAPLFSGIIAGIVGGVVVSLVSGSTLGVSGPAAGLAVIVLTAINDLGAFPTFLLAVVIAGVIQLLLGFGKAGVIGYYFPSSVIKGMLSGIGIIIILKQIPHAFGYDKDPEGDLGFIQSDGQNTFSEMINMIDYISPGALIITIVSIAILVLWEQPIIKKRSFSTLIQGPLVAVVVGIGLNILFRSTSIELKEDQMVSIPVADSIAGFFSQFTFPDFSQWNNTEVWIIGVTIAIVASLETLLCVEATDKLDPEKNITPTNRELKAQGIGNIISGLIGGLPVTQVIVRSSANIQSGGKSKASAFFHGILLLITALLIPSIINLVPLSSLAAILFIVGFKLAKPSVFKDVYAKGKYEFIPFIITILGIIFTDLLLGIALGMVVAIFHILYNNYRTPYSLDPEKNKEGIIRIDLAEDVSFLNKAGILRTLNKVPDDCTVIICAAKTRSIHPDILEIIEDFRENALVRNIKVELQGLRQEEKLIDPEHHFGHIVLKNPLPVKKKGLINLFLVTKNESNEN